MFFLLFVSIAAVVGYWLWQRNASRSSSSSRVRLAGKHCVITGGGSGIGRELALLLACRHDAEVHVWDIDEKALAETVARAAKQKKTIRSQRVDVSNAVDVENAFNTMLRAGHTVDVFVNNAGVATHKPFLESSDAESERVLRVNLLAHFYTIRKCCELMKGRGGSIVEVSSTMDTLVTPNLAVYTASKWANTAFAECLRLELLESHPEVHLMLVRPWIISDSPMFANVQFWTHPYRHALPPTNSVDVASAIVRGIINKEEVITLPWFLRIVGVLYHTVPRQLGFALYKITGADKLLMPKK